MKRLFLALTLLGALMAAAGAQTTTSIGNLPAAATPLPSYFSIVDDGTSNTWKSTLTNIIKAVLGSPIAVTNGGTGLGSFSNNQILGTNGSGAIAQFPIPLPIGQGGTGNATGTIPIAQLSPLPISTGNGGTGGTGCSTAAFVCLTPGSQQTGSINVSGTITAGGNVSLTSSSALLTMGASGSYLGSFMKMFTGGGAGQFTLFDNATGNAVQGINATLLGIGSDAGNFVAMDRAGDGAFAGSVYSLNLHTITTTTSGQVIFGTTSAGTFYYNGTGYYFYNPGSSSQVANVDATTGAYTATSDRRLKRDVHQIPYGLNTVEHLNPAAFTWKADGAHGLGFIAQDVRALIPEVVSIVDSKHGTLGINYSGLIPVLARAIQQQQDEITSLQAQARMHEPVFHRSFLDRLRWLFAGN
jgi:hypothetical protein